MIYFSHNFYRDVPECSGIFLNVPCPDFIALTDITTVGVYIILGILISPNNNMSRQRTLLKITKHGLVLPGENHTVFRSRS